MFCQGQYLGLCRPRSLCYLLLYFCQPCKNVQTLPTPRPYKHKPDVPRPPKTLLELFATFGLWDSKKFFTTAPHCPGPWSPDISKTESSWDQDGGEVAKGELTMDRGLRWTWTPISALPLLI